MNQTNLINKLSQNLQPVRKLGSPRRREIVLWVISLIVTGLGLLYWYERKDEIHFPIDRSFVELVLLLIAVKLSGQLALRSASPHFATPKIFKPSWFALVAWTILLLAAFGLLYFASPTDALVAAEYQTWLCPTVMASIAIPLAIILLGFISRGVVLYPKTTSFYVAQTAVIFGTIGLSFICPWTDPLHELLWHVLPLAALIGILSVVYFIFFKTVSTLQANKGAE